MFVTTSRRGRLRLAVATCLVLAVAGCAMHTAHEKTGEEIPGVVPAPKGLKFSVRVMPLTFHLGDRVSLEASLFNDSEDAYKKKYHSRCIWDYDLTTMDGVSLRAARECIPQDTTMVLAPGELGVIVRQWSGRERYFNSLLPLTPGRYQVVAGFLDADHNVIPMSAPVEIQVLERSGGRK